MSGCEVSGQYGEILHDCAEVFSRAEGEGKYCTRVQCLAILTTNPVNERFIIHFFDHWRLTTISQRTSEHSEPGRYPRVSASRSHRGVRRLSYSCIVYAKYCSRGSEKRLGWRASGNRSGTPARLFTVTRRALPRTLLTAELAIVYGRFQRSEDQPCRAIRGAVSVRA